MGKADTPRQRIQVSAAPNAPGQERFHAALVQAPWMSAPIRFRYPETVNTDALDFIDHVIAGAEPRANPVDLATIWSTDESGSLSFHWEVQRRMIGGRLSPNEDDVDLEFWIDNRNAGTPVGGNSALPINGTMFADPTLARTYLHAGSMGEDGRHGPWRAGPRADTLSGHGRTGHPGAGALGQGRGRGRRGRRRGGFRRREVRLRGGLASGRSIVSNGHIPCVHADPLLPFGDAGRRVYVRGKLYLLEGNLDDLYQRVARDILRKF